MSLFNKYQHPAGALRGTAIYKGRKFSCLQNAKLKIAIRLSQVETCPAGYAEPHEPPALADHASAAGPTLPDPAASTQPLLSPAHTPAVAWASSVPRFRRVFAAPHRSCRLVLALQPAQHVSSSYQISNLDLHNFSGGFKKETEI